ncbi:bis(5'-nucleosyl)-tetraphosphatase (symmetrical) YqeK [Bacillus sp. JCM 19041]|uniref:bis(5'-nucleosyl)-tetraphosphatase (symmetrical) YqeK n=1 Tax=Bacillus sp. JCM 19041 TaxID=1460637 RepID=UPI000AC6B61D
MAMTPEEALQIVRTHLTESRYMHTLGVRETAIALAKKYQANVQKAELAAIFHDICKYHDNKEMEKTVTTILNESDWAQYGKELLHAPCGAFFIQQNLGIEDEEILQAVKSHTTGRANMSLLEKVIFVADYIEPNRKFPGVETARDLASRNLDEACQFSLKQTMLYLLSKELPIHPETMSAYNFYILKGEKISESTFSNGG